MTGNDVEEFFALDNKVAVPRMYTPNETIEEALKEIEENELFFIKKGTQSVGMIGYQRKPDGSIYISNMAVLPEYRGQHIARKAMAMILEMIGSVPRIWLVVHPENVALKLYTSLGFVVEERVENYFGDGEPRLVLAKPGNV